MTSLRASSQGTAIGAGNLSYFYAFTGSICPLIILCIVCVVITMSSIGDAKNSNDDFDDAMRR